MDIGRHALQFPDTQRTVAAAAGHMPWTESGLKITTPAKSTQFTKGPSKTALVMQGK